MGGMGTGADIDKHNEIIVDTYKCWEVRYSEGQSFFAEQMHHVIVRTPEEGEAEKKSTVIAKNELNKF